MPPFSTRASPSPSTATSEGTERIFPYDLLPRIITGAEWATHRARAHAAHHRAEPVPRDIYHDGRILDDGIVPRELVYSCAALPPRDARRHVRRAASTSRSPAPTWSRLPDGRFAVLEDNLRVPSGVLVHAGKPAGHEARLPAAVHDYARPADRSLRRRRCSRRCASLAPDDAADPTIVLLTPGVYNSAYFEHTFLARQMGIELVEGRDLVVHDNVVYMRTTARLRSAWT